MSKYGPWRIKFKSFSGNNSITLIRDGILRAVDFIYSFRNSYNMWIEGDGFLYGMVNSTFYGCFVRYGGLLFNNDMTFIDSVMVKKGSYSTEYGATLSIINCALNYTESVTPVNSQYNWEPLVEFPLWDAPKEAFNTTVLFEGIEAPPQPGTPPYTNYETDLFGNQRTGIGTGNMLVIQEEAPIERKERWTYNLLLNSCGGSYSVYKKFKTESRYGNSLLEKSNVNDITSIKKEICKSNRSFWYGGYGRKG